MKDLQNINKKVSNFRQTIEKVFSKCDVRGEAIL